MATPCVLQPVDQSSSTAADHEIICKSIEYLRSKMVNSKSVIELVKQILFDAIKKLSIGEDEYFEFIFSVKDDDDIWKILLKFTMAFSLYFIMSYNEKECWKVLGESFNILRKYLKIHDMEKVSEEMLEIAELYIQIIQYLKDYQGDEKILNQENIEFLVDYLKFLHYYSRKTHRGYERFNLFVFMEKIFNFLPVSWSLCRVPYESKIDLAEALHELGEYPWVDQEEKCKHLQKEIGYRKLITLIERDIKQVGDSEPSDIIPTGDNGTQGVPAWKIILKIAKSLDVLASYIIQPEIIPFDFFTFSIKILKNCPAELEGINVRNLLLKSLKKIEYHGKMNDIRKIMADLVNIFKMDSGKLALDALLAACQVVRLDRKNLNLILDLCLEYPVLFKDIFPALSINFTEGNRNIFDRFFSKVLDRFCTVTPTDSSFFSTLKILSCTLKELDYSFNDNEDHLDRIIPQIIQNFTLMKSLSVNDQWIIIMKQTLILLRLQVISEGLAVEFIGILENLHNYASCLTPKSVIFFDTLSHYLLNHPGFADRISTALITLFYSKEDFDKGLMIDAVRTAVIYELISKNDSPILHTFEKNIENIDIPFGEKLILLSLIYPLYKDNSMENVFSEISNVQVLLNQVHHSDSKTSKEDFNVICMAALRIVDNAIEEGKKIESLAFSFICLYRSLMDGNIFEQTTYVERFAERVKKKLVAVVTFNSEDSLIDFLL